MILLKWYSKLLSFSIALILYLISIIGVNQSFIHVEKFFRIRLIVIYSSRGCFYGIIFDFFCNSQSFLFKTKIFVQQQKLKLGREPGRVHKFSSEVALFGLLKVIYYFIIMPNKYRGRCCS